MLLVPIQQNWQNKIRLEVQREIEILHLNPRHHQRKMTKGIGTLVYQAPEIIRGETDYPIDKTDIYSMAVLLLEVFTRKEPFTQPPFDKWSKWEIEKFVSSGKRIEIPSTVHPKIRDLITKCWSPVPLERLDFNIIVRVLSEVMDSLPATEVQNQRSSANLSRDRVPSVGSNIPSFVPVGNLQSIGWVGELDRKECEIKLKGAPIGTFMLRWSKNTDSYVLTYQTPNGTAQHIAFIKPDKNGHISVDKEDGKKAHYDNIFEYISAMRESTIISRPFESPKPQTEDLYGKTPTLH